MADKVMTSGSELSAIVPEVWSKKYYDTLLQKLPFNSIIDRSYEGEISSLGDTVNINTFPEFAEASVDSSDDVKEDADSVTVTQQQLVINKRVKKDFIVTNKATLQSLPAMDKLRDLAVYAINKKMQSIIIGDIVPSASSPDHQISYDSGTTLALADLLEGKELLDGADVPMADRHLVMDAPQMNDIFNITNFTSSDYLTSGSPSESGELPSALLGFQPHFTTAASAVTYLFHKSFMTMAAQQGLNIREYDLGSEGKRATRVNVDTLFGLKQLDDERVVEIS